MTGRRKKPRQMTMNVRLFNVRADGLWEFRIQASNAGAAKYRYYKLAREAGYLSQFRDLLQRGLIAVELHRPFITAPETR